MEEESAFVYKCYACCVTFASARALNIHDSKKHGDASSVKSNKRRRGEPEVSKQIEDDVSVVLYYGDVDDDEGDLDVNVSNDGAGAVEDGSTIRGYDSAPCETLSQTLFDLDAEKNTPVSEAMNEFPSWGRLHEATVALALNGPVSPVDFVASVLLTREEVSLSCLLFKVPMSAMDKLQELLTEWTRRGLLNFDDALHVSGFSLRRETQPQLHLSPNGRSHTDRDLLMRFGVT